MLNHIVLILIQHLALSWYDCKPQRNKNITVLDCVPLALHSCSPHPSTRPSIKQPVAECQARHKTSELSWWTNSRFLSWETIKKKEEISITPFLCYPEPGPFITDTDLRTCTHIKNVVKRRGSLEDFQSTIGGESLLCLENGSEMNNTHRETAARHKVDWSSPF